MRNFTSNLGSETNLVVSQWRNQLQIEVHSNEKRSVFETMFQYAVKANCRRISLSSIFHGKDSRQERFDTINTLMDYRQLSDVYFFQLLINKLSLIPDSENSTLKATLLPVAYKQRDRLIKPIEEKQKPSEILVGLALGTGLLALVFNVVFKEESHTSNWVSPVTERRSSWMVEFPLSPLVFATSVLYLLHAFVSAICSSCKAQAQVDKNLEIEMAKIDNPQNSLRLERKS